ncbi:MAG: uridine kinase [Actinomycetota bacterium]
MALLVGICGGSGSGKTTLARRVAERFQLERGPAGATVVSFDAYYRDQGHLPPTERAAVNYDHPDSLDGALLAADLRRLQAGAETAIPVYDFATHTRSADLRVLDPADVIVVEGILLFSFPEVRNQLDFRVFRQCPEEIRFERRIRRDQRDRGRTEASVRAQLAATVKPMHDRFVEPYAAEAHFVTQHGQDLDHVTDTLVNQLRSLAPAVELPNL